MTPVPTRLSGAFPRRLPVSTDAVVSAPATALRSLLTLAQSQIPSAVYREGLSLLTETDERLLQEGILSLAGRLERSEVPAELGLAVQLYQIVAAGEGAISRLARERGAVLQGGGTFGARTEFLLRSLARQASDPAMLVGMGLATGVFSMTRALTLSRLLAAPAGSVVTRGFGARALASVTAFAVEAPTFTLATRLAAEGLGRNQVWTREALGRDLASSYLVLGALKFAHWGGHAVMGGPVRACPPLRGERPLRSMSEALFRQSFTLGGIFVGHGLETWIGLRSPQSASQTAVDSLAMLLQFHVAGRLSANFMGRPYANMEAALDRQARMAPLPPETSGFDSLAQVWNLSSGPHPALVGGNVSGRIPTSAGEFTGPQLSLMTALGPGGGGRPPSFPIEGRLDQLVRPEFNDRSLSPPPRRERQGSPHWSVRRIGILTSGGDGPGENAALAALVRGAIEVYDLEPFGIFDGYRGLLQPEGRIRSLMIQDVSGKMAVGAALRKLYGGRIPFGLAENHSDISTLGGDFLRSSRTNPVLGDPNAETVKRTMSKFGLDALIVLGGNGSMRAANALREAGVPLVAIPQSIDLDIWGSEHSIGFPSAVAKGASEVHHFTNTAHSCDRWFLVEVMGQHYGMLTLAVGRESRVADSVFIEVPRSLSEIREVIDRAAATRAHGVLLFSEGVKFRGEGVSVIEPPRGTDVHGRLVIESGDVVRWLRAPLAEMGITHTRPESLGYLLRGADPTPHEIALAQILSEGALRLVETRNFGRMVGTDFVKGSSDLRLVYPKLSQVARFQKPAPEEYFLHVGDLLEGRGETA